MNSDHNSKLLELNFQTFANNILPNVVENNKNEIKKRTEYIFKKYNKGNIEEKKMVFSTFITESLKQQTLINFLTSMNHDLAKQLKK